MRNTVNCGDLSLRGGKRPTIEVDALVGKDRSGSLIQPFRRAFYESNMGLTRSGERVDEHVDRGGGIKHLSINAFAGLTPASRYWRSKSK